LMVRPTKTPRLHLEHMRDAIAQIEVFVAGKSLDEFMADQQLRWAVERAVEIISEASRRVPEELKARHPVIPWRSVVDVGDVLRHGYDVVAPARIWEVATVHLGPLKAAVEAMPADVMREWGKR
jgi:uncharacterized protein with HEPN domain